MNPVAISSIVFVCIFGAASSRGGRYKFIASATGTTHNSLRFMSCKDSSTGARAANSVAIAWMLAQPAITSAIVGATSAAQLKQSLPATELQLDEEEMDFCNDIWMRLPRMTDPGLMR